MRSYYFSGYKHALKGQYNTAQLMQEALRSFPELKKKTDFGVYLESLFTGVGTWAYLPMDEDKIRDIWSVLSDESSHDVIISDYTQDLGFGETEDILMLNQFAEDYQNWDEYQKEFFKISLGENTTEINQLIEYINDQSFSYSADKEELAQDWIENNGDMIVSDVPEGYFDENNIATDLIISNNMDEGVHGIYSRGW